MLALRHVPLGWAQAVCRGGCDREGSDLPSHCGSDDLFASEAQWALGPSVLDVYLSCYECELETQIALSREEYKRCGFDPYESLPD